LRTSLKRNMRADKSCLAVSILRSHFDLDGITEELRLSFN